MIRVLHYLLLELCTASTKGDHELAEWYRESWQWLERLNDELEQNPAKAESEVFERWHNSMRTVFGNIRPILRTPIETAKDHNTRGNGSRRPAMSAVSSLG
jgi:hypothetical protein